MTEPQPPVLSQNHSVIETYVKRDPAKPIAGQTYPLTPGLTSAERRGLLVMIEAETSRVSDELSDVREHRRKLRDLGMTGLVAVVASVMALFSGKSWLQIGVIFLGYVLVVVVQVVLPAKFFEKKQAKESELVAELDSLRRLKVEYEIAQQADERD